MKLSEVEVSLQTTKWAISKSFNWLTLRVNLRQKFKSFIYTIPYTIYSAFHQAQPKISPDRISHLVHLNIWFTHTFYLLTWLKWANTMGTSGRHNTHLDKNSTRSMEKKRFSNLYIGELPKKAHPKELCKKLRMH